MPDREPLEFTFRANGKRVTVRIEDDAPAGRSHSPDFRAVSWDGASYTFSPTQAAVVRQLWEAMEAGAPAVGQETLIEGAGSEAAKLSDLFRRSPAWGTFIIEGERKGTYQLAE